MQKNTYMYYLHRHILYIIIIITIHVSFSVLNELFKTHFLVYGRYNEKNIGETFFHLRMSVAFAMAPGTSITFKMYFFSHL